MLYLLKLLAAPAAAQPGTGVLVHVDARVYDAASRLVRVADDLDGPRWTTYLAALDNDTPFTLVVTANHTAGGTGLVARTRPKRKRSNRER